MKQKLPLYVALLMMLAAFWAACTKPTPFGSELLEDELANYEYTDTVTVICTIQQEDSLLTSDRSSTTGAFLCGELNDPIFGKSTSEIFSLLQYDLRPGFKPSEQFFDSIVLYMRYAPTNIYGDTTQPQTLQVYRLDKLLDNQSNYYAESSIPATELIGSLDNFLPRPNTTDSLFDPTSKASFVSVRLDDNFGKELFNLDSLVLESDSAFFAALRGIKIVSSSANAVPGAMLAFNLNNATYSRVRLYYHTGTDTIKRNSFDFFFAGANKFTHFIHDYTGTPVGGKIDSVSDDFLYLQAMQGLKVKVEIPFIDKFENIAVNKAALVLTTVPQNNGIPALTSAEQLALTESQGDSTFVFTSDVLWSLGPAFNLGFDRFGGDPVKENVNGTLVERYRLTMSDKLQTMVDNVSNDPAKKTVYINITPQGRVAQRSVFYGPKNATFPAKLELKYTRVE